MANEYILRCTAKAELHYKTDDGFQFTVPIEDCGDGAFLVEDKAMMFMRYIRKQLDANKDGLNSI
jgi:hypothetical protein